MNVRVCIVFNVFTVVLFYACGCSRQDPSKTTQLPSEDRSPFSTADNHTKPSSTPDPEFESAVASPRRSFAPNQGLDNFKDEAIVNAAIGQLKRLNLLCRFSEHSSDSIELLNSLATTEFVGTSLRPDDRKQVYTESGFEVSRARSANQHRFAGHLGLHQAIRELTKPFDNDEPPRLSFHIYEIQNQADKIETLVHMESKGTGEGQLLEQDAHWRVTWHRPVAAGAPKIAALESMSFEEVMLHRDKTWFSDQTQSVFGGSNAFEKQLALSNTYWQRRIERHHLIDKSGHHGISVGDVNDDGLDDIYVCQPGGLPNRLFLQTVDGTLREFSSASGTDFLDNSRSALIIDFDNNGTQDIILTTASGMLFLSNNGQGIFRLANNITKLIDAYSIVAADYDADGDLDIYACRYYRADANPLSLPIPTPYFNAQNGGQNYLIRNDGNWKTSNATDETGLGANNNRFSYAAIWIDYDLDGDQDLYVVNDFGRNNLYRNDLQNGHACKFTDIAMEIGMHDGAFGMSASAGDFDRDGWEDIYVGNMYSSAGSRISRMREFQPKTSDDDRQKFQHLARGNTLFQNAKGKEFRDVSVETGVTMGRWSWGSQFVDFDNNGWQDLIVSNGYITGDRAQDDL